MIIIWLAIFVSLALGQSNSIEEALLNGKSQFTNESLHEYLENLERLNEMYQEIYQKKKPSLRAGHGLLSAMLRGTESSSTEIHPVNGRPDQIPYLFEGDILLTEDQMKELLKNAELMLAKQKNETIRQTRSMTSDLSLRWTRFPIQYYITPGVPVQAVQAGITRWQQLSCITFQQLSRQPIGNGLIFIRGNGCYSYIGKTGFSPQQVSIGVGCESLGTVMHEIGHALGFYHEQARSDRDSFVQIVTRDIQSIYLSQFTKQSPSSMIDYGVPYDYGSVMHYDQFAFSSNGLITIQTLDSNYQLTIGQRNQAAFADVKKINLAYCNASCSSQLPCLNGGYTDPLNCDQCRCPDGLGGDLCDEAAISYSGCPSGNLEASSNLQTLSAQGSLVCNYLITAPIGKRIFFQVTSLSFPYQTVCSQAFVEIKYNADLARTGARFCQRSPSATISGGSSMVVIFQGASSARFSLTYRYDPPDSITDPIQSTTTAGTLPPISPSTPSTVVCAPWGSCGQPCGACGTQSRVCSTGIQTRVCNPIPCQRFFCCSPFRATIQGICVNPSSDENVLGIIAIQPGQPSAPSTLSPIIQTMKPQPKVTKKWMEKKIPLVKNDQVEEGSGEIPKTTVIPNNIIKGKKTKKVTKRPIGKKIGKKMRENKRQNLEFVEEVEVIDEE